MLHSTKSTKFRKYIIFSWMAKFIHGP